MLDSRIRTLDLNQPGAVDELLAFHHALIGSARMDAVDDDEGDEDGDEDGKPAAKKAAAKKTAAKKATAKKAGSGDDGDGDGEDEADESEKAQKALTEERRKVSASATAIAKLTGKSKTEVSRALRKGGDALDTLLAEALENAGDGDEDEDGKPAAKKTAAKKTAARSEAAIRREAEREAEDRATARIVRSEVKALAADTFANPNDAVNNLDLDDYELDEDGDLVDLDQVKRDLAALLKKHPHYARKKGPKADSTQGRRGGSGERPTNIRELSRMRVDD